MKPPNIGSFLLVASGIVMLAGVGSSQIPAPSPQTPVGAARKVNERSTDAAATPAEPFDGASTDKMAAHCVTLETDTGSIEIEMMPEVAPENARSFLNLTASAAFDTTTFSRVVKGFIIQGGNLSTSEKWGVSYQNAPRESCPTNQDSLNTCAE